MRWLVALAALGCSEAIEDPSQSRADTQRLPLEVVGVCPEQGICAEAELTLHVDGDKLVNGDELGLTLTLHNVVEPDMARLTLNDDYEVVLGQELLRAHGGAVEGRVQLAPGALKPGPNRLRFQYTRQVKDVSGYRVLAVGLDFDRERETYEFAWDDPNGWQPFSTETSALQRGQRYFSEESRDGGPVCARCHADSGADLAYFAFSNRGIVERAKHHEFPQADAEDIASFLRSLDVERIGTVVDPPFQPGPDVRGAAGAGFRAPVDDAAFGEAVFGPGGAEELPDEIAWDFAKSWDFRSLPAPIQTPAWFRWLPREVQEPLQDRELDSDGTTLRDLEATLTASGGVEDAQRYLAHVVDLGSTVLAETGDHVTRIELLRLAAVKLWDWSRKQGFAAAPYGFPEGAPPYPYEVGFAFFEAGQAGLPLPNVWQQTIEWWWVQLAVDPGRGRSNGLRPLNYRDVLLAAESAGLGPNTLVALHLYGSWEESRGDMQQAFGGELGPVRLLEVVLRHVSPRLAVALWRRFLLKQEAWVDAGGSLDAMHRTLLRETWEGSCDGLSPDARAELRQLASAAVNDELSACP